MFVKHYRDSWLFKLTHAVVELTGDGAGMLTKNVWERTQKLTIFKQIQTYFKAKREKGVAPFSRFALK